MPKDKIYFEINDFMVSVKKIRNQSGLKNVMEYTYYIKDKREDLINGKRTKKNELIRE